MRHSSFEQKREQLFLHAEKQEKKSYRCAKHVEKTCSKNSGGRIIDRKRISWQKQDITGDKTIKWQPKINGTQKAFLSRCVHTSGKTRRCRCPLMSWRVDSFVLRKYQLTPGIDLRILTARLQAISTAWETSSDQVIRSSFSQLYDSIYGRVKRSVGRYDPVTE